MINKSLHQGAAEGGRLHRYPDAPGPESGTGVDGPVAL